MLYAITAIVYTWSHGLKSSQTSIRHDVKSYTQFPNSLSLKGTLKQNRTQESCLVIYHVWPLSHSHTCRPLFTIKEVLHSLRFTFFKIWEEKRKLERYVRRERTTEWIRDVITPLLFKQYNNRD
jgi:hypothetical protein